MVTVTTASAQGLYAADARVIVGQLSAVEMLEFVQKWRVRCVLDASHPFAAVVSRSAIALAKDCEIAYLRYERAAASASNQLTAQALATQDLSAQDLTAQDDEIDVAYVDSLDDLIETDILQHQRVLFTVGYRHLAKLAPLRKTSVLFARVLPSVDAITEALSAGFSSKEIVALRPPVSLVVEAALWQQWDITCVVAKASGAAGGESVKRAIATQLGVKLVLIKRPQLTYPNQTNSVQRAVAFCSKTLRLY